MTTPVSSHPTTATPARIAIPVPTLSDADYNQRSWVLYADAVRDAGGVPVEVSLTSTDAELVSLAASCQGVLLPGSPADVEPGKYAQERIPECAPPDPDRERVDIFLLEHAQHQGKPVFGICFGTQMLNVWRGGSLVQDLSILPVNHGAGRAVAVAHTASVAPDSMLGGILREQTEALEQDGFLRLPINSSHHQAVGAPGDGLRIVARCPQDAVIEAVEGDAEGQFVLGVQWHPERSYGASPASRALFARFLEEARGWTPASEA